MKIVTATYVISDEHIIDDYCELGIQIELRRVQDNSDNGLMFVGHKIINVPHFVEEALVLAHQKSWLYGNDKK